MQETLFQTLVTVWKLQGWEVGLIRLQFLGGKGEPLFISSLVLLLRIRMHVKGVK